MKLTKLFAILLIACVTLFASSCKNEDDPTAKSYGTVTGTVTDDLGIPLSDVTVTITGVDGTVSTNSEGKYTVENVSIETHAVTFSKTGYLATSVTVTASKFISNIATANMSLRTASAKIVGSITDALNGDAPLSGVKVSINLANTTTSGTDGSFTLENLIIDDYTVTFEKEGYTTIVKAVSKTEFSNNVVTINVRMGGNEILPGLVLEDLLRADKWYYNEYRGGRNSDSYPHWDWSTDYMCALDFQGAWAEQNEGTTLQIRNTGDQQNNPANMDAFDSFVYGSKLITSENKILSLRVRTHDADAASPAYFGVRVVDLSTSEPSAVVVGTTKTHGSGDYADYDFDLSAYTGKEVIVAIGIYRHATGDYWKQLVLRAIRFADRKVEGTNWLPGTEVLNNWKITQEMVRSTMVNTNKTFTGISPVSGNRDNYVDAYRAWRGIKHIATEWSLMPTNKDPEVFPSEGFLIKTRGNGAVDTETPEAYFYSKFAIANGNNRLTLKTRNFGSNYTYFKLTAIKEDGTTVFVEPISNTAQEASAAENGCWKFKHGNGGANDPDAFASFVYDLSQFNGSNVVLAFSIHNGELNGDENKLVFYSINFD